MGEKEVPLQVKGRPSKRTMKGKEEGPLKAKLQAHRSLVVGLLKASKKFVKSFFIEQPFSRSTFNLHKIPRGHVPMLISARRRVYPQST